ncbi:hypothetical protein AB0D34_31150 [Streptomyces sp. NPDC048420]|uniref:hypothetical protein n=1 Tax=Streptomyces sp. NPDC048420 TaxID=3155755 RepID=UPI003441174E
MSNANGNCITTDNGSETNVGYAAPSGGGRSGQFWTADDDQIQNQNQNGDYLRNSDSGDGVYTSGTTTDDCGMNRVADPPRSSRPSGHVG